MRHLGDQSPWIVIANPTAECTRCEAIVRISLPVHSEVWRAAVKAFVKVHRRCREPRLRVVSDFRAVRPGEREVT